MKRFFCAFFCTVDQPICTTPATRSADWPSHSTAKRTAHRSCWATSGTRCCRRTRSTIFHPRQRWTLTGTFSSSINPDRPARRSTAMANRPTRWTLVRKTSPTGKRPRRTCRPRTAAATTRAAERRNIEQCMHAALGCLLIEILERHFRGHLLFGRFGFVIALFFSFFF